MPRAAKVLCVRCDTERAWQRRTCLKCGATKTKPVPVVVDDAPPDGSCDDEDGRALDLVAETSEPAAAESEEDSEEDSEEESEEEGDADPQDEKEQKKLRKKARNDADRQRLGKLAALQPPQSTLRYAVGPRILSVIDNDGFTKEWFSQCQHFHFYIFIAASLISSVASPREMRPKYYV